MMDQNLVATIIMTMSSYLQNVAICTHCARSIEWILAAGKEAVCKALWDEGVFPLACDVLKNHVDSTLLGYICSLLSRLIRMAHYDARCVSEIQNSGLISIIEEAIQRHLKNESTLASLLNLLAVLISNRISPMGVSLRNHRETPAGNESLRDPCENRGVHPAAGFGNAANGDFVESFHLWYVKKRPDFVTPRIGPKTNHELRRGGRRAERAAAVSHPRGHPAEHNWNTVPAVVVLWGWVGSAT